MTYEKWTAVAALKAQIRLLWAQGVITENALQVLHQPITDFCNVFKQTESMFYEIRNILADGAIINKEQE